MTCMKLCCVGSSWGGSKLCCVESRGQTHWGHCACPRKHTYCTREDKHFELIINVLVSTLLILARTSTLSSWSVHFELMVLVLASTFHVFARTSTLSSLCLCSWAHFFLLAGEGTLSSLSLSSRANFMYSRGQVLWTQCACPRDHKFQLSPEAARAQAPPGASLPLRWSYKKSGFFYKKKGFFLPSSPVLLLMI